MSDVLLQCDSMRETFRHWHAEQESLEAQLSESLAALSAYQSHLDAWQQQLARERDELREARKQLERDSAATGSDLAVLQSREKELTAALDQQKCVLENERARWAKDLEELRRTPPAAQPTSANGTASAAPAPPSPPPMDKSPVLGSIMEQFGKLRQQRATDRHALKKVTR